MGKHIHTFWKSSEVIAYRSKIEQGVTIIGRVEVKDSRIKGSSFIHAGTFMSKAKIRGSDIDSCFISGASCIYDSELTQCQVATSWIQDSRIAPRGIVIGSDLFSVETQGFCFIEDAKLNASARFHTEDPKFVLKPGARITGVWSHRPAPEVIDVPGFGYITEGLDGTCWVACKLHKTDHWLRHSAKYFRRLNLPEETREGILNAVQEINRLQGKGAIYADLHCR